MELRCYIFDLKKLKPCLMKNSSQTFVTKFHFVFFLTVILFSINVSAQYNIVVNGPSDICGPNNTYLSVNPAPTGLTVNWYKNNINLPGFPYATGPILQSPETGNWTCEVITSTSPFLQSVFTQTVRIRTNQIYIESPLGTTSCSSLSIDENASNVAMLAFYDFYQWKKNGVSIPGANNYTYSATSTGIYTCQALLGCGSGTSNPLSLTFENPPTLKTITANGALTFCQGGSVVLSIPPTAGLTYQWRRNSVDIPGATGTSFTATQSGTYNCREISVSCGYINSTSKTVVVNPLPTAAVIAANGPTTFCVGSNVLLSGNTAGGVWSISGSTAPTLLAAATGDYYVTNSNSCGSVTSNHILVTVNALPTVSMSGLAGVYNCMNAPVVLSGSPAGGTFSGTGITGNVFNPRVAGVGGPYTISYSYSNSSGCSSSASAQTTINSNYTCAVPQNVTVSQIAKKTAVISWNSSAAPSFKVRYRKTGSTTYLYQNVAWSPCNATTVQLTGLISNTSYTVDVKAVCSGAVTSYSSPVTFKTLITNPSVAAVENRSINEEITLLNNSPKPELFPNPFSNELYFNSGDMSNVSRLLIMDFEGRVVYEVEQLREIESQKINTSQWPSGVYFVRLIGDEGQKNYKIIKN